MHKRFLTCFISILLICMLLIPVNVHAGQISHETPYIVVIDDSADLLKDYEEESLHTIMSEISAYGNVAFKSYSNYSNTMDEYPMYLNNLSTQEFALQYYREVFGYDSGTLFLIDMYNREIFIFSDGAMYDTITTSYAYTITDNVYRYASNGDYYTCAYTAYDQILSLLKGQQIAQPMKYISNTLLSITLAMLINYFIVMMLSKAKEPSRHELIESTEHYCLFDPPGPRFEYKYETRKYSPQNSGSGGGGSFSGGGGGSSGGGGGHSF